MKTFTPREIAALKRQAKIPKANPREPTGRITNALPGYWLAVRDDGALWIMGLTKDDDSRLLATIAPGVAEVIRTNRGNALTLVIGE